MRGLLQTLLSAEGYDVVTASDGLAGLVEVSTSPPALVLLDLVMPDLGGVRVLEEMRDDPELVDVPVIVVTGKIDAALARIEDGTYGDCVRCGEAIAPARLALVPDTPFCAACAG